MSEEKNDLFKVFRLLAMAYFVLTFYITFLSFKKEKGKREEDLRIFK